jgi:hypothetical protein
MSVAKTAALAVVAALAVSSRDVCAQTSNAPVPGRVEASVGVMWVGHQALGDGAANETTGTGSSMRIFTASSDLGGAGGVDGRVAVRLQRSLEVAMEASYARPKVNIALGNDIENAARVVATETMQQLMIGGSLVWYLPSGVSTARLAPFATGGGGYLRQVHEDGTLVGTGRYYQFGGGVKYLFFSHPGRRLTALGARAEARAVLRAKGVAFDEKLHAAPALGVGVFLRF